MARQPYSPTEVRILEMLSDGKAHTREELCNCLYDELSSRDALRMAIMRLRKKLRLLGQEIVVEMWPDRSVFYRHVRIMASPNNGYT